MPRRPGIQVVFTDKGYKLEVPASLSASGKRERYFYGDEKAAIKHAAAIRKAYHERGTKAGIIPPALAEEALKCQELLAPLGATLLDAVRDYVKRHQHAGARLLVSEAWAEYEDGLIRNGRSDATITDYKRDRRALPDSFLCLRVADATEDRIAQALDACTSKRGKTWNRRLREVRAVLRAAVRIELKPASIRRKDPEILSSQQATAVMKEAVAEGCAVPFALMLFAGIRPEGEISRISWSNIRENHIEVTGEESKTTDDRHIPISDNLAEWLRGQRDEAILPTNWKRKYQAVRKAAGVEGQDVLRHTFASMFYRLHGEHETIAAMGHTSFKTTERFYKRAVSIAEAQAFFMIAPSSIRLKRPKALRIP